jgi:hypothetical protein
VGVRAKEPLRALTEPEEQELQRIVKATSEREDTMRRAKALLEVTAGQSLTTAGQEAAMSRKGGDCIRFVLNVTSERSDLSYGLP